MFIHLFILGILVLKTAALSLECDQTITDRPGILVLVVATATCSFVSIVGNVAVTVLAWFRSRTSTSSNNAHTSKVVHFLLSVSDIFIGLRISIGLSYKYQLAGNSSINFCECDALIITSLATKSLIFGIIL